MGLTNRAFAADKNSLEPDGNSSGHCVDYQLAGGQRCFLYDYILISNAFQRGKHIYVCITVELFREEQCLRI